jgi:hypothetical protein
MRFERRNHGRGHSYWLDGTKLPGVTTILGEAMRKRALENWAAEVTAKTAVDRWDDLAAMPVSARLDTLTRARWEQRDAAALDGTQIHTYAEAIVTGAEVDVPPRYLGQVQAVARFMDAWGIEPVAREASVFHHTDGWAGTIDLLAGMRGTLWLLDWKTGKGVYPDMVLQLAAYAHASHMLNTAGAVVDWVQPERCGLVHVTSDSATLYPVAADDDAYLTFRYCQQVWAFTAACEEARQQGRAWPIGPALDPAVVAA